MPMDSYYTDRFDKYANDLGIYHVLFSCPRGIVIKEKHRVLGMPPPSEQRRPCEVCVGEIKDWLVSLPDLIRPSQFGDGTQGAVVEPEAELESDHDGPEQQAELREEEGELQAWGEIVVPE